MMSNDWRWVPGYRGLYDINSVGTVRTYYNGRHGVADHPARTLKQHRGSHGYLMVNLRSGGKHRAHCVHELVLRAFAGVPKPGQQARHLDGDKDNNDFKNLVWGTRSENTRDQVRHGTFNYPHQYRYGAPEGATLDSDE